MANSTARPSMVIRINSVRWIRLDQVISFRIKSDDDLIIGFVVMSNTDDRGNCEYRVDKVYWPTAEEFIAELNR